MSNTGPTAVGVGGSGLPGGDAGSSASSAGGASSSGGSGGGAAPVGGAGGLVKSGLDLSTGTVGGYPPPSWLTFSYDAVSGVATVSGTAEAEVDGSVTVPAGEAAPALIQFNPGGTEAVDWTSMTAVTLIFELTSSLSTTSAFYQGFVMSGASFEEWYGYGDAEVVGGEAVALTIPLSTESPLTELDLVQAVGIQVYDLAVGESITIAVRSVVPA